MSCQIIASDIFDFAELLVSHNIIQDAKSLYDASARLQSSQNVSEWKYECGNIKFSAEGAIAGSIPQQIYLVEIIFSISLVGIFQNEGNLFSNPLTELSFDIELEGWDKNAELFYASWHLDKHIESPQCAYVHPEYHFTFGGNKLEEKGNVFGSSLILPSPRIVYPPMDVILGIDFILQNYFSRDKICKLLEESKYREIISSAQQRIWKPYYLSLANSWSITSDTAFEKGFEHFNLNPHIR